MKDDDCVPISSRNLFHFLQKIYSFEVESEGFFATASLFNFELWRGDEEDQSMNMESNEKFERIKRVLPSIIIALLVVLIIGLIVYSFVSDTPIFIITKLYNYAVNKIISMTGLSQWLVKGIVIIALIPMLWVIKHAFRGEYKNHARAVGMLYIGVFFLSLYFMSKDIYFSHSGNEILKYYALTPDGVWYSDTPGIDPVYGKTLKPVTPEVIRNLKLIEKGDIKPIDPNNFTLFNPITGEAQAWYYKYPDGTLEFFGKPGYHPISGDALIPVTKQVFFEWKDSQAKKASQKSESGKAVVGGTTSPADTGSLSGGVSAKVGPSTAPRARIPTAEGLKLLINQVPAIQAGKPNVAIVLKGSGSEGRSDLDSVTQIFSNSDKIRYIPKYFKDGPFVSEGYFDDIFNGNTNMLRQANVFSKLDYLILGKVNYTFKKVSQFDQEMVSCDLKFNYKVINKDAHVTKSDTKSVVGPAFSESVALDRALEILKEKHLENILNF